MYCSDTERSTEHRDSTVIPSHMHIHMQLLFGGTWGSDRSWKKWKSSATEPYAGTQAIKLLHSSGFTMNGKSRAARSLPIGAFVFHYSLLCMCVYVCVYVCVYSSSAASLFLGPWPEVHLCVANQQKMTGCDQGGRTFHIQQLCSVACCSAAVQLA